MSAHPPDPADRAERQNVLSKGPQRKTTRRYRKRVLREEARRTQHTDLPQASDVQVFDTDGNLIRIERTRKPLT